MNLGAKQTSVHASNPGTPRVEISHGIHTGSGGGCRFRCGKVLPRYFQGCESFSASAASYFSRVFNGREGDMKGR